MNDTPTPARAPGPDASVPDATIADRVCAGADALDRAASIAALGLGPRLSAGALAQLVDAAADPDPRVRAAAIGALVRRGTRPRATAAWRAALDDPDPAVRRRSAELTATLARRRGAEPAALATELAARLADADVTVVEAAAWALGELGTEARGTVDALAGVTTAHDDALAREAAVAALGAIGDGRGLAAILGACTDKPAVRRRAVLALAPFGGPDVDAAIERALTDRDWQVRQAAEDLQRD